jgi:hypothetical protein
MAFVNYHSIPLRASAITSGTSEQDTQVDLPETVTEFWAVLNKTAEANADNLLTVRIQALVGAVWFDLAWDSIVTTTGLTVAADVAAANVTRTAAIVEADSTAPTYSVLAHYAEVPSNTVRVISVTSGTTPTHTFSVDALFPMNML